MTGSPTRHTSKVCVICGQNPATTRDHLPPKALFLKPYPDNLITVPACEGCNGGGSGYDDEFQAFLAMHVAGHDERGSKFFQERGRVNLEGNERRLQALRDGVQEIEILGPEGDPVGRAPAVLWDSEAHDAVVERMIRGLYWHHTGHILSPDAQVDTHWYRCITLDMFAPFLVPGQEGVGVRRFRNDEVVYAYFTSPPNPEHSLWLFQFYGGHSCGGHTRPAGFTDEADTSQAGGGEVDDGGPREA